MSYAGLDLSRKRLDLHLLDAEARPDADGLRGLTQRLDRHGAPIRAAIESMNGARFVHDQLPGSSSPLSSISLSRDSLSSGATLVKVSPNRYLVGALLVSDWGLGASTPMFLLRSLLLRRLGPFGVALLAYDLWRRVPKSRRRQLYAGARLYGSRVVRGGRRFSGGLARWRGRGP
jgi:hypothetical protein